MLYDLGIIIPVYRARESVKLLTRRLREIFADRLKLRICLVDDSGQPGTADYLAKNCRGAETVILVLDCNYGQQAATLCGLEHIAPCRYYATIDEDMEQPPEMLSVLYDTIQQGYDIIYGVPEAAFRPLYRRLGSLMRDQLFSSLLGTPPGLKVSSLRMMTSDVVVDACSLKPRGFFYLSASIFQGSMRPLHAISIPYRPNVRKDIKSGYRIWDLAHLYGQLLWHYGIRRGGKRKASRPENIHRFLASGPACRFSRTLAAPRLAPAAPRPLYRIARRIRAPKLLILGGSNCQLSAFYRAKELGIDTVLADYTKMPPAASIAGLHEPVSTFDLEGCLRAAKFHHVDGIMTLGTDQPVYTAAYVSHARNLPAFLSVQEALSVTNKRIMKQILKDARIPTAKFRLINPNMGADCLDGLHFPVVLKPLDSQGQRGIFRLDTPGEVLSHLPKTLSFSRENEALAEEYYESTEITVSGWIHHGYLHILTVTDRLLYPDPVHIGVCIGHRFPSVHMDRYKEIEEVSRRTAAAFHLSDGPFYLQLLCGGHGIFVNELASRIGGAFEDKVIPLLTGFDILDAVIRSALGQPVKPPKTDCADAVNSGMRTAVQLLFARPGIIESATDLEELLKLPYVLDAGYNYRPGQTVPVMENASARFGHAVICGEEDTIAAYIDDFYRHLSVRRNDGTEMIKRLYPQET